MSLVKQFQVRERVTVEFSALFGVAAISRQNFPRNMQFALRLKC